jgi:hypothetical protein
VVLAGVSALIAAFWVAICAAAPEFIWQGLRIAWSHLTEAEVLSALLVGLVLAFFVEPLMERLRGIRHHHAGGRGPGGALFTVALSLAFALASITLHDAMTAFVAERSAESYGGLAVAIRLTTAWAAVPFAVTLAWLSTPVRRLAVPLGILAALSPCLAGWTFAWPLRTVVTTAVPSLLVLGLGYRRTMQSSLARRRWLVAWVAMVWLATALVLVEVLGWLGFDQLKPYNALSFWMDVRFYLGWTSGLMLAPSSRRSPMIPTG